MLTSQLVSHLEAKVCPPGTRVWPVQRQVWLDAVIDCGIEGKMRVKGSNTDYVFLTQEGWDHLNNLCKQGITIVGDHILEILPLIIGFYEVRKAYLSLAKYLDGDDLAMLSSAMGESLSSCMLTLLACPSHS